MGIVLNQSLKNTVITYIGFGIGGINTIYLYPVFLGATFYGLTNYVTSCANVIMPLFAIGMQNTLVKFYSQYQTEEGKSRFLSSSHWNRVDALPSFNYESSRALRMES